MYINIRDILFIFTVYASFKHTFSVAVVLNFSFLEFLVFFCFFCLPFCHAVGGRDNLKKRKIRQEIISIDTVTQMSIEVREKKKVNKNIGINVEHNKNNTHEYADTFVRIWKKREFVCMFGYTYAGIRIQVV